MLLISRLHFLSETEYYKKPNKRLLKKIREKEVLERVRTFWDYNFVVGSNKLNNYFIM